MRSQTTPVTQLLESAQDVPGWSPPDQLSTLFTMVYLTSGLRGNVLEVGSWCGRSSIALGLAAKLCGNTKVSCIDLFPERNDWRQNADGSYSMTVVLDGKVMKAYHEQTVWREPFERDVAPLYAKHHGVLEIFRDSVARYSLDDVIEPHKGTLRSFLDASDAARQAYRMAFIDGDHSYEAVCEDIRLTDGVLVPGGWVCFDDAFTSYEGVDRAIRELIIASPDYELGQQMTKKMFVARKRGGRAS